MLHRGEEEAFTALLQSLDEEDIQHLDQVKRLVKDPGLSETFWEQLFKNVDAPWLIEEPDKFNPDKVSKGIKDCFKDRPLSPKPSQVASSSHNEFLQLVCMILLRMLAKLSARLRDTMPFPEHYSHLNLAKLFFEALGNPGHKYKDEAEAALHGFNKAVEKTKVTSLNRAASKYHISVQTLSEWVAKELIPYEYRDKNAIYLAEEIAQEVARDIEEAKEMGMQTARLLRERHDKYFPPASDKLADPLGELQSQAKLGSEGKEPPSHYPHDNVGVHSQRLRAESLSQEAPTKARSGGVLYERGRLTTLTEASKISGVKLGTLHNYLSDGKLTERGRIKAPGGKKVLIDLDELDSVLSSRKPGGRPRKIPERLTSKRPRGRPRKIPRAEGAEPKLIILKEASEMSGIPLGTLANYISDGLLTRRGRQRSPAPGGGKVLVDPDEVLSLQKRPVGRPRKTPRADEGLMEQKPITLKQAVETYGIAYETLRSWYRSGYLPERGREAFHTHGGGRILVDENDVIRLINNPPARGRPQIKPTE